jgi:hypothetical protein
MRISTLSLDYARGLCRGVISAMDAQNKDAQNKNEAASHP